MPPRRCIRLLSALVHATILSTILVVQLLSIGPLPTPRTVLAFTEALPVRLQDIPLPPPSQGRPAPAPAASTSPDIAPIEAPSEIAPEREPLGSTSSREAIGVPGVESGIVGGIDLPGHGLRVDAPPPPPAPQEPIRLHSGMTPPRKVLDVPPRYPSLAQAARKEGIVVLDAVIDPTGPVTDVRVTRSVTLLDQAAVEAVLQWQFTPTLLNGRPVSVLLTVTVRFSLGPS